MKLWDSILTITDQLERLYLKKVTDKEKEELYSSFLRDLLLQEETMYNAMTEEDFESFKNIFCDRYHLSFETDFLLEALTHPNIPNCVLRIYKKIYEMNTFFLLQRFTKFTKEEASFILGNSYVEKIQKEYQLLLDFQSILLHNYGVLNPKERSMVEFFALAYPLSISKDASLKQIDFSLYSCKIQNFLNDFYRSVISLTDHLLSTNDSTICVSLGVLLKTYLESVEKDEQECIRDYVQYAFCKNDQPEKFKEKKLKFIQKIFESYDFSNVLENKKSSVRMPPSRNKFLPIFSTNDFVFFHETYQKLLDNSFELWMIYRVLVESKKNMEPKDSRSEWAIELQKLLEKEEVIFSSIPDFEQFQNYVLTLYSRSLQIVPFYVMEVSEAVLKYSSLDDIEIVKSFVEERLIKIILERNYKVKKEEFSSDLLISEENQKNRISRIETILTELIRFDQGQIDDEIFFEILKSLKFGEELIPEDFFLTNQNAIFCNYMISFQNYLKNNPNSPYYDLFCLAMYCVEFLESDLRTLLIKDFSFSYGENFASIKFPHEADYIKLQEYLGSLLFEHFSQAKSFSESDQIVYQIYLNVLESFLEPDDFQYLKDLPHLSRILKK